MTRPSPTQSATLYKTGTRKLGNDGKHWVTSKTKAGIKRWVTSKSQKSKKSKIRSHKKSHKKSKSMRSEKHKRKTSERKSPEKSATLFAEGTKKTGLDGNIWKIAVDKNGTHRWKQNRKVGY